MGPSAQAYLHIWSRFLYFPNHLKHFTSLAYSVHLLAFSKCKNNQPWLVCLSGLSAGLQTKRSPVRFPIRAHAWVVGQVPSQEHARVN